MTATLSLFDRPGVRQRPVPRAVLRPYQEEAISRIGACLAESQSTLLVLPTGTGKTRTAVEFVRRLDLTRSVLWLAHRQELIDQAAETLDEVGNTAIEKADRVARGARIVVASVQTLKGDRLSNFRERFEPDVIITDEAHHAPSASYRAIYDAFPRAKHLGLTATPDRHDEKAMGVVFDSVAFVYEIHQAIADGFLCPVESKVVEIDGLDVSAVGMVGGDFNQGQLDDVCSAEKPLHGVVDAALTYAGDRRTIVFTTSVENAHRMAEIANRTRPGQARAVDGQTDSQIRRTVLRDHQDGRYQFLFNVGVLTEGYDDPAVSCIVMGRPTKSRALYAQCAGRGLRIAPGKTNCLLIDPDIGNADRLGLSLGVVSAADLLGGTYDDETLAIAKKKLKESGGGVTEALAEAKKEIEARRFADAQKRIQIRAKVQSRVRVVDPFAIFGVKDPGADDWSSSYGTPASNAQLATLERFKVPVPEGCTKQQASKLIGTAIGRREHNLCTFRQMATLQRYGIDAGNIGFDRASDIITALAGNSWRPLQPAHLAELMERRPGEDG